MSPQVEPNLALLLFLPWFSILAVLFWCFPRRPRGARRTGFDVASLAVAGFAAVAGMRWGLAHADPRFGHLWPQILATSVAYGLFLAAMTTAVFTRRAWLGTRASARPLHPRTPQP